MWLDIFSHNPTELVNTTENLPSCSLPTRQLHGLSPVWTQTERYSQHFDREKRLCCNFVVIKKKKLWIDQLPAQEWNKDGYEVDSIHSKRKYKNWTMSQDRGLSIFVNDPT